MSTDIEKFEDALIADLAAETAPQDLRMTREQLDAWADQIRAQRAEREAVEERRTSGHWDRVCAQLKADEVRSGRALPEAPATGAAE